MTRKIRSGFPVRRCSWSYRPIAPMALNLPTNDVFARSEEMIIARWEDSQNAVNLLRSTSNMNSFRLAVFSKRLDAQAVAASAESVKLEKQEAPQKEIDRQKKEVDDLDLARQKNKTTFRP